MPTVQARRQYSVIGGAEIIFGGQEKFIYVNSKAVRGTRNQKLKQFFRPKTGDLQRKGLQPKNIIKSGVGPQKSRKYRWQTPIWASICTPVAPSLLISSGHSTRLWGTIFVWGGTSSHFAGTARNAPRGAGPAAVGYCAIISQLCLLCHSKLQCLL